MKRKVVLHNNKKIIQAEVERWQEVRKRIIIVTYSLLTLNLAFRGT